MTIKLNDYWSERLVNLPETGMGYQKVDIILIDGRTLKGLTILNAEDCLSEDPFNVDDILEINIHKE
jgi:hypothetical protein